MSVCIATPVCLYVQDLTGEKKLRDIMTSLLLSEKAPPDWDLHPELATMVDRRGTSAESAQKGNSSGDSPAPNQDPALSTKVTTGGLSASVSRWKVRCHLLWIDGSQPPVHVPLLGINVEVPWGIHNGRKAKGHFPARQWRSFLCLTFLSLPQSNDKSYHSGQIWPALRALVYLTSGLLLGRPPLLSFFPHSF
jgi:hypothetical protein